MEDQGGNQVRAKRCSSPRHHRHAGGARGLPGHPRCRPHAGRGIASGDAERVALIANYYENILSFLEAHHDGEEHLVFPLLREPTPARPS